MNINQAFPSKYLAAADLQGREPTVMMNNITYEKVGDDNKPVLYFQNKEKGLVLNKTNAMTIASMYGPETDGWFGKPVTLIAVWTDYQGKAVQAIRIKPAFPNPQQQSQQMQAPQQPPQTPYGMQGQAAGPNTGQQHPGLGDPPQAAGGGFHDDSIPFAPAIH